MPTALTSYRSVVESDEHRGAAGNIGIHTSCEESSRKSLRNYSSCSFRPTIPLSHVGRLRRAPAGEESAAFNEAVILTPYIDSSEMSIVGPPPYTGAAFFFA